ncbi:MAG: hypothetical protein ABI610_14230, partial [Acidobacteriota bacterium]
MKRWSRSLVFSFVLLSGSLLLRESGLALPHILPQVREVTAPSRGAKATSAATAPVPSRIVPSKRKTTASVQTDRMNYEPGDIVRITGAGWQEGEIVELLLHAHVSPVRADRTLYAPADTTGHIINDSFSPGPQDRGVRFTLTATGGTTRRTARTSFGPEAAASPNAASADIDQCANGGVGDPPELCTGGNWVNGNLGSSKAHYFEGDSVPYRMVMTGLSPGTHTLTIEWDTTQSGKHALDYLTTWDRTVSGDPCSGVSGCGGVPDTFPIPVDPGAVNQIPGDFTLYGGTITSVSAYTLSGSYSGNSSTSITITFTTTGSTAVLAWGGHIATRADWGLDNAAVNITGSPYHMRLVELDGSGGSQDR